MSYHNLGVQDAGGRDIHVCDDDGAHFVGEACPNWQHKPTRFFVVAVAEEKVDFFVEENLRADFVYGLKQVIIEGDLTDVEVAY